MSWLILKVQSILSLITELPAYNYIFTSATTTHVIPTMYHHTTTTAIVESRAQPVATEHAIPTSTQTHLPLVIGKNQLPQYCYFYRVCIHRVQTPSSACMHVCMVRIYISYLLQIWLPLQGLPHWCSEGCQFIVVVNELDHVVYTLR